VPLDDAISNYVVPQLADYSYDNLNRITNYHETQYNGSAWVYNVAGQTFSYDRYGNRNIAATLGGVNGYNPSYNANDNRIVGLTYDSAGNITNDGLKVMAYDAENHMVSATGGNYGYDGEGKRVKRVASGQEWWYVYGLGGELVAEYLWTAPTTVQKEYGYRGGQMLVVGEAGNVRWLVTDHLGSTRMTADNTGSLTGMKRQDYLPFGEDLYAGIRRNGGNGQYGYEPPASSVRQKFTGYERDAETGLDFAEARYSASLMGRFTSPDPLLSSAILGDPQSWNRYSYVGNRPTVFIDPTGLQWGRSTASGEYKWFPSGVVDDGYDKVAIGTEYTAFNDKKVILQAGGHWDYVKPPAADISGLRDNTYSPFFLGMIGLYTLPLSVGEATTAAGFAANVLKDQIVDAAITGVGDAVVAASDLDLAKRTAQSVAAVMNKTDVRDGTTTAYVEDGMVYVGHSTKAGGGLVTQSVAADYANVPEDIREASGGRHGCCGELPALSAAELSGASGRGGAIATASNWNGKIKPPCPSCSFVLPRRGIRF
jgi:RHS repeat-associated protein